MKKIKVVILYRVISHYRLPVLEKLNRCKEIDLTVIHGCDFPGTKVTNSKAPRQFKSCQLKSFPIKIVTSNGLAVAPFSLSLIWALYKANPDVIVCEGASNLPNNLLAYLYAKLSGTHIIQWGLGEIKGWSKSRLRRTLDNLIVWMERSADACITYSSRGRDYYRKIGIPDERIFVAVNVVDTDRVAAQASQLNKHQIYDMAHQDNDFVVLFVGALNVEKKVDMLITAFQEFTRQSEVKSKLLIVGEGDERRNLGKIAKRNSEAQIEFVGQVIDDVSRYFLMADIFVLPGLGGLAISEAMAYGLPVIASIGDGCEVDLLANGAGILDENLNQDRLIGHLQDLSSDRSKLELMKQNALSTIKEKYNTNTYVQGLLDSIKHATNSQ